MWILWFVYRETKKSKKHAEFVKIITSKYWTYSNLTGESIDIPNILDEVSSSYSFVYRDTKN